MATNYDKIADQYHKIKGNPIKKYSEEYSVLHHIDADRESSILDLACGDGHYSRMFCQNVPGVKVVGVDVSVAMIERAQEIDKDTEYDLTYHVADVATLELNQTFNLVTAVYLLGYAPDEETMLGFFQTAYRHLPETGGGRFLTITGNPNLSEKHIDAQRAYGAEMTLYEPSKDGAKVKTVIRSGDFELDVENYHWFQDTHERLARKAGFTEVIWHNLLVAPEAIELYGKEFWQPYLEYPGIVLLECKR